MPFTLLGQILKNFVFGLTMCKLIPYFQVVKVHLVRIRAFTKIASTICNFKITYRKKRG
ncbi:hypothetical protein ALC60_04782 [Trachymyrmex zeteki]|uniref:Uncharacterized protein n=1 Tax=Mycetomoellerius zeteki TaxID=64791 RepID=A0A151X7S4_9HYME|nr:hypothetical protein ALC60_04782 [Trachymyrmex zeteki]